MELILGLDGGGSKTTVRIADTRGISLIEKKAGSSNYKSVGIKIARDNINYAVIGALESIGVLSVIFKSACFGLAGNDTDYDMNVYRKIIFNNKLSKFLNPNKTIICNDSKIGLAAGSSKKNRLMIISGTGANCFGVNEFGLEAKANIWDYILGDEGSGYTIGLKALKAVVREYDGRGSSTLLSKKILEYLGLESVSQLVKWVYDKSYYKERIAELAKTVCNCAEMGDKVSQEILEQEAKEAAASVNAVAAKLGLKNKDFDLVLVGGVFRCKKYFKALFFKILKNKFKKINFKPLTVEPVEGAIKLALEIL